MINKQKLWFLTLFSLILVLSVYYITMPDNLLKSEVSDTTPVVSIKNKDEISVLRELNDEERIKAMEELKLVLTNIDSTIDEKNNAYEKLKIIEDTKTKESKLEEKIKNEFNIDSFISIDNNQIKVVIKSSNHNYELANNIIRSIQDEFDNKMYISVKFN